MMQSLRIIIIFAILVCDVIRGNASILRNEANTEYTIEFPKTLYNIVYLFFIIGLLIAFAFNLRCLLLLWYNWLRHEQPIVNRIRATFRTFWQSFAQSFVYLRSFSFGNPVVQQTHREPDASYNTREEITLNII